MRLAAVAVLLLIVGTAASPTAQQLTADELTISPYKLVLGSDLSIQQRIAKRMALVQAAERAGDYPRAARHLAIVCAEIMQPTRATVLTDPSCVRAYALAERYGLRDVTLRMMQTVATSKMFSFDFNAASAAFLDALKYGEGLDPNQPDNAPIGAINQLLGSTYLEMGRYEDARARLSRARDICRATGDSGCAAYSDIWLCRDGHSAR